MANHEVPKQAVEGAAVRADLLLHLVATALAVVRHAVDVGSRGRIGLGGEGGIGSQRHPMHIGKLHPLVGIDKARPEPVGELNGTNAEHQAEIAKHHQPLDVVSIAGFLNPTHRIADTGHLGAVWIPEEVRQRLVGSKSIGLPETGHAQVVDPADELPPADHLADEAFHRIERSQALVLGLKGPINQIRGVEQTEIQGRRDAGVPKEALALHHGVLEVAVVSEALLKEGIQAMERIRASHRPPKALRAAPAV